LIGSEVSSASSLVAVAVGLADAVRVGVGVGVGMAAGAEDTGVAAGGDEKGVGTADDSAATGALLAVAVLWAILDGLHPTNATAHAATATNLSARTARPRCRQ
jgi:hypothetical protein